MTSTGPLPSDGRRMEAEFGQPVLEVEDGRMATFDRNMVNDRNMVKALTETPEFIPETSEAQ